MAAAVREGAAMIEADIGRPPDDVARRHAAAAAAIAMEIINTEPGTDREQAVAAPCASRSRDRSALITGRPHDPPPSDADDMGATDDNRSRESSSAYSITRRGRRARHRITLSDWS